MKLNIVGIADENDIPDEVLISLLVRRIEERQKAVDELKNSFSIMEKNNRRLLRSEQNKTRFLSLIRNEFNNPLLGMMMLLKALIEERENDHELKALLETLFHNTLSISFHLNNIMSASTIESGKIEENIVYFSVEKMLFDIKESLFYLITDNEVVCNIHAANCTYIYQDLEKLQIIMMNALSNALRFSPPNSAIHVNCQQSDTSITFEVSNPGKIIADMEAIFDPFYQEDLSYSREHHGLGLGLSVIKGYVSFMRGEISMQRKNEMNVLTISVPIMKDNQTTFEQLSLQQNPCSFEFDESSEASVAF
jgi:signal transduction histidine kinase